MNIWIFCHYASVPSIGQYTGHYDLARGLVHRGHQVTIFATSFSHYTFKETLLGPDETSRESVYEGVRFVWLQTPPYNANDWRRIRNMFSYSARAAAAALSRSEKPDVCVGVCVHPLAGLVAWLVAKRFGAKFVYEIRDLWPLQLIEQGRLREDSLTAKAMYALERFLVTRADRAIGAWKFFDAYLGKLGYPRNRVAWIPQFVDLDRLPKTFPPEPSGGPFTVMYTGGHTNWNCIDVMLRAAKILEDRGVSGVRFVFMGSGQEKPNLVRLAEELNLKSVEFRNPVPKDQVYAAMAEAHAYVVGFRDVPHCVYGISTNKLTDYLGMRRPIIYATSSTYNPVTEAQAGISAPAESAEGIADAVVALRSMRPAERAAMGERGFQHMLQFHERSRMVEKFEQVLVSACAG